MILWEILRKMLAYYTLLVYDLEFATPIVGLRPRVYYTSGPLHRYVSCIVLYCIVFIAALPFGKHIITYHNILYIHQCMPA